MIIKNVPNGDMQSSHATTPRRSKIAEIKTYVYVCKGTGRQKMALH